MTGAVDLLATIILGGLAGAAWYAVVWWIAGGAIKVIDLMTGEE